MDFDRKYPGAEAGSDRLEEGRMLRCRRAASCAACKAVTPWVEVNYRAHVCSEECLARVDRVWQESADKFLASGAFETPAGWACVHYGGRPVGPEEAMDALRVRGS